MTESGKAFAYSCIVKNAKESCERFIIRWRLYELVKKVP